MGQVEKLTRRTRYALIGRGVADYTVQLSDDGLFDSPEEARAAIEKEAAGRWGQPIQADVVPREVNGWAPAKLDYEQATRLLAEIYLRHPHPLYRVRDEIQIQLLLESAFQAGRERQWAEAEALIDRAYHLVGSENQHTGYAWHCGRHPLLAIIAGLADE